MNHDNMGRAANEDGRDTSATRVETRIKRLEKTDTGQLVAHLEASDEKIEDVTLARCFPWSLPDAYISILNAKGNEICMLSTLDNLDAASRKIVDSELRDKVFNPKIKRIVDSRHEFGISSITAKTDRGTVIFQIRGRNDVRFLSATRALFRDVDGNTYELPDYTELDAASMQHIRRYF